MRRDWLCEPTAAGAVVPRSITPLTCALPLVLHLPPAPSLTTLPLPPTRYGTRQQQVTWLLPLLRGAIRSCFAMTEKAVASSDATNITSAIRPALTTSTSSSPPSSSPTSPTSSPGGLEEGRGVGVGAASSSSSSGSSSGRAAGGGSSKRGASEYVVDGVKWWTSGAMDPRCQVRRRMGGKEEGGGGAGGSREGRGRGGWWEGGGGVNMTGRLPDAACTATATHGRVVESCRDGSLLLGGCA